MTFRPYRFGIVVVLSLASLVACGGSGSSKGAESPAGESERGSVHAEVGKPAPDLSIQSLNGKGNLSLESLQGKVIIVDFWATWCAPCKASFPKLEELSKKIGDNLVIIGVSVDDERTGVVEFAKENGATFAVGWDEGHRIAERWNVKNMPTTFVVDASGKVRHIHAGYHDGETDEMEKEVLALMDESPSGATTRVAKNDEPKTEANTNATSESNPDPTEPAPSTTDSSRSRDENEKKATAVRAAHPKKKGPAKKGGRPGGKAPAAKKHVKKK